MGETDPDRRRRRRRREVHVRGVGDFLLEDLSSQAERQLLPFLRNWPHAPSYAGCVNALISGAVVKPALTSREASAFPTHVRQRLRLAALDVVGAAGDYRRLRGSFLSTDERAFAALYWRRERQLESRTAAIDRLLAQRAKSIAEMPTLSAKQRRAGQLLLNRNVNSLVGLLDSKPAAARAFTAGFESPLTRTLGFHKAVGLANTLGARSEFAALAGLARTWSRSFSTAGIGTSDEMRRVVLGIEARERLGESMLASAEYPFKASLGLEMAARVRGISRGSSFDVPTVANRMAAGLAGFGTMSSLGQAPRLDARAISLLGLATSHMQKPSGGIIGTIDSDFGGLGLSGLGRSLGQHSGLAAEVVASREAADPDAMRGDVIEDTELDEAYRLIALLTVARARSAEFARDARATGSRVLDAGGQWLWEYPLVRLAHYREAAPYLSEPQRRLITGHFATAAIAIVTALYFSWDSVGIGDTLLWLAASAQLHGAYASLDVARDELRRR